MAANAATTVNVLRMGLLFGTMYLVQGICEPTTGLLAQPDESLLRNWGYGPQRIASFMAVLSLPWCLKPVFGLLSDFVPLGRHRRKNYLLLASLVAAVGFIGLSLTPLPQGADVRLLAWLLLPTVAVICADVVIDALMIETGQPLGLTGRLQSVQWSAVYAGSIVAALAGGVLSDLRLQQLGFLLCGALMTATFLLTWLVVRERRGTVPEGNVRGIGRALQRWLRAPGVAAVAGYVFFWHFNPCSQTVIYLHITGALRWGEEFYAQMLTLMSIGSLVGSVAYGFYCRCVPMNGLVHLAVLSAVATAGLYFFLGGKTSALAISLAVGFTYMTGNMILVDLAARSCPLETAGTTFATFMALCNIGTALSTWLGGLLYEQAAARWGGAAGLQAVVFAGGLCTAMSWLAVPHLPRQIFKLPQTEEESTPAVAAVAARSE